MAAPGRAWLLGGLAWLIPGLGHLMQKKYGRGLLLGGVVWGMFALGQAFAGHFYPFLGSDAPGSTYLDAFWSLMGLGTGAIYLVGSVIGMGFTEQAARVTFEYGDTFLKVAGLLNYLAMLDAFDLAVGRKS